MDKKIIAKKTIILYIFKLLYNGSSYEKPITSLQITNVLHNMGIDCSQRTIMRNIQYLIDFGLPIFKKKGKKGGYFYYKEKDTFFNDGKNGESYTSWYKRKKIKVIFKSKSSILKIEEKKYDDKRGFNWRN